MTSLLTPMPRPDYGHPLNKGLIGWWHHTAITGTQWGDIGPRKIKNGVTSAPKRPSLLPPGGMVMDMDGSNDYLDVGAILGENWGSRYCTVAACVRPDTVGTMDEIVQYRQGSELWKLQRNGSFYQFEFDPVGSGGVASSASGTAVLGKWQHVVGTFDGTDIKVYVDGKFGGTASGAGATVLTDYLTIGGSHASFRWNGVIADVRVSEVAMPPAAILQLYQEAQQDYPNLLIPRRPSLSPTIAAAVGFRGIIGGGVGATGGSYIIGG